MYLDEKNIKKKSNIIIIMVASVVYDVVVFKHRQQLQNKHIQQIFHVIHNQSTYLTTTTYRKLVGTKKSKK